MKTRAPRAVLALYKSAEGAKPESNLIREHAEPILRKLGCAVVCGDVGEPLLDERSMERCATGLGGP